MIVVIICEECKYVSGVVCTHFAMVFLPLEALVISYFDTHTQKVKTQHEVDPNPSHATHHWWWC